MSMKPILVLALARPTFDVPYAQEMAEAAFAALDAAGLSTHGPRELLFDADSARAAIAGCDPAAFSGVLLLQMTFTDASMSVEIAQAFAGLPLVIWAFPEPRAGGRLRLNSFCGLNLAAHALGRAGLSYRFLHEKPDSPRIFSSGILSALRDLAVPLAGERMPPAPRAARAPAPAGRQAAQALQAALEGARIGLLGEHPAGFDTCRFEPAALQALAGIAVEPITLEETFAKARAVKPAAIAAQKSRAQAVYAGLETVDQPQLEKSLALLSALETLCADRALDALAVRCWPETFTEYGCAVCGALGTLTEAGIPAACEADMFGAVTLRLLQAAAGAPAWLVDIVDMDAAADLAVFWHCGSAPASMCDPQSPLTAQIHSNRKMPLLGEFTLKPGRITLARLSQARNQRFLLLGGGEVIRAPMPFTGTSATVRLDGGAGAAREILLEGAIEHHIGIVYGEHRAALEAWAAKNALPVMELTPCP